MGNCLCCRRKKDDYFDVRLPTSKEKSGTPKKQSSVRKTVQETPKTARLDAVNSVPNGEEDCTAPDPDQGPVQDHFVVNNTSVGKDGPSSGSVENVTKAGNEFPVEKTRDDLNDTLVGQSDLPSDEVDIANKAETEILLEKTQVTLNNTPDDKDGLSVGEVEIVNNAELEAQPEKEVEQFTSTMENTENYGTNITDKGGFNKENSQTSVSMHEPGNKRDAETKAKENSSSEETDDGKIIPKLEVDDPVDSCDKKTKLKMDVPNDANAKTRSENPEIGEGDGKITSTETEMELLNSGTAVAKECVQTSMSMPEPCNKNDVETTVKENFSSEETEETEDGKVISKLEVDDPVDRCDKRTKLKMDVPNDANAKTRSENAEIGEGDGKITSTETEMELLNSGTAVAKECVQTSMSMPEPCNKNDVETTVKENFSSEETEETEDGKVISKLEVDDPVDSCDKKDELDMDVADDANAQTRIENAEFGEGDGLVTGKITSTETKTELINIGRAVPTECVDKELNDKSSTKEDVCIDEFVSETPSETSDNKKSHQSTDKAQSQAQNISGAVSSATEHVQNLNTSEENFSAKEDVVALTRREELKNEAAVNRLGEQVYSLKESCSVTETNLEEYRSVYNNNATTAAVEAKREGEVEEDYWGLSLEDICGVE